jgi:hypothetical protein
LSWTLPPTLLPTTDMPRAFSACTLPPMRARAANSVALR